MKATWTASRGVLVIFVMLGCAATAASAQEPETLVVQQPEIVVRALRGDDRLKDIPAAAFVIPRAQLARAAEVRLSSMLQSLPGLYAYQSSASGEPTVVDPRGFTANGESSYLKVLINGRDTRDLENGNVDWDWLSPEAVERLEVVEGPAAWAYGDGSEGGIVNIVSNEWNGGLDTRATLRGGSFDHRGGSATASWSDDRWSFSGTGVGRDVNGWRDHSREIVRSGHALFGWRLGTRTSLTLDGSWLSTNRENPGALTPDQIEEDRTQTEGPNWQDYVDAERGLMGLTFAHGDATSDRWTIAPYARLEDVVQLRTLANFPLFHPTNGNTYGADLGWRRSTLVGGRNLQLGAGYQFEQSELHARYYDYLAGEQGMLLTRTESRRMSNSGYLNAQLVIDPRWTVRAGLRADALRLESDDEISGDSEGPRTLSAVSPFAALTMTTGEWTTYVSGSGAFHAPTLNQLYDQLPITSINNPELDPQRSSGYEIGTRWDGAQGGAASFTFYDVFVKDEIDFNLATISYANIGKSRHTGVLAALRYPLPRQFTVYASGTVAPTTIREGTLDGNQINAVPLASTAGRVEWSGLPWLGLNVGGRWVAKQYLDKENLHPLGEYATMDIGGWARLGRASLNLRVLNLLDREYSDTGYIGIFGDERLAPAAPRSLVAALSFQ
ncbi:MAG TPA: TonB-dependent receptor [Candidatus Eisenbacteria bacterium]|nr:TonB-dependent receptor [Candidatus Eisenbacteria bacterium]